jgi:hypothetical protein
MSPRPRRVRKRPRFLKNPQGVAYVHFNGLIAEPAFHYLLDCSERMGFSQGRTLSILLLEHKFLSSERAS